MRSNMIFAPVDRIEQVLQLALETAPMRRDGVEPKAEPPAVRESALVPKPVGVAARRG